MNKKARIIIIVLGVAIVIVFALIGYFNIVSPVSVKCVNVECGNSYWLGESINRRVEAYKEGTLGNGIIVYDLEGLVSENPDDYRFIAIDLKWKNRSRLEGQQIDAYITKIDTKDMVLYSRDLQENSIKQTYLSPGEEMVYSLDLYINIANRTDKEVIDMLKTITIYYVTEGERTGIREKEIKLSEVYDLSKVVIER